MTSKTDTQLARLEDMLTRLETLEGQVAAPNPQVMDAYGNPGAVAPGDLIESVWGNSVVDRVVHKFPTKTAMDATSAPHGTVAFVTDSHVMFLRVGVVWVPTSVGNRVLFYASGPAGGQAMPPSTVSLAAWTDVADPYNVFGTSYFTVPPGWAGLWTFEWAVEWPDGAQNGSRLVWCQGPGSRRLGETNSAALEGGTRLSGSASIVLAESAQVYIQMYHDDTSGGLTCNSTGNQYFQGYYVGPTPS